MKRPLIAMVVLVSIAFLFFGCSNEKAIETTIGDFEAAVNNNSVGDIKDTLSPDSDFYITQTFQNFLDYFKDQRNVNYPNPDITVNGDNGDALCDATYDSGSLPVNVQFVMKKEKGFFSFLFPSWKVLEYWDDAAVSGTLDNIWKRIQMKMRQQRQEQ
jgi:uncharacterized membrane protein YvbJ